MKPKVVCFCGSTRFAGHFMVERWKLEKQGIITLGINILPDGYFAGENHHGAEQEGVKHILDDLHLRKIDLADEVVILNVDGYIGESTRRELDYAKSVGKPIKYLEPTGDDTAYTTDEVAGKSWLERLQYYTEGFDNSKISDVINYVQWVKVKGVMEESAKIKT
jgi:hypothetical protein